VIHLIVIVRTRPILLQAAGIAVGVVASTVAAGTAAAVVDTLVARTPVVDTVVADTAAAAAGTAVAGAGLRWSVNMAAVVAAARRNIGVSVSAVRPRMAGWVLRARRGTRLAERTSHSTSRQQQWQQQHHRYRRGYPIQSVKVTVSQDTRPRAVIGRHTSCNVHRA
jgi:hypothetical protein